MFEKPVPSPTEPEGVRTLGRRLVLHRRHPQPCQRAYMKFRGCVLNALAHAAWFRALSRIQSGAWAILFVIDVPIRWLMDIADTFIGNRGYVAIGTIFAAYFAAFGLIDAKSTQEETHASLERSLFITLVSSGNAASFVSAMKSFGPTQTILVTEHPSWFRFWQWNRTYQPNKGPLRQWGVWRLALCDQNAKDCSPDGKSRIDLRGADLSGADLSGVDLHDADLHDADLHDAHLIDANLTSAGLGLTNLAGTHLTNALLIGAEMVYADLQGADMSAAHLSQAKLLGANLIRAYLGGADLSGAILQDAYLIDADLNYADLGSADLTRANLTGANLSNTVNLDQKQLDQACGKPRGLGLGFTLEKSCPGTSRNSTGDAVRR
jgi:Pentapeptide repeats (8 copies)